MESVGKKARRQRRAFTPEFKAEIVELCQRGDRSVGQVAKDFDLTETAVREWVRQAGRDAGTGADGAWPASSARSWPSCGPRSAGWGRTWRSSSGRRLSSRLCHDHDCLAGSPDPLLATGRCMTSGPRERTQAYGFQLAA
jgi:hypothetical protein